MRIHSVPPPQIPSAYARSLAGIEAGWTFIGMIISRDRGIRIFLKYLLEELYFFMLQETDQSLTMPNAGFLSGSKETAGTGLK